MREQVWLKESLDNKLINQIAEAIESFENTLVGAISKVRVSPPLYVAVELSRNIPDWEIKPTIGEDGLVYTPKFSRDVWLKPRTWLVRVVKNGGFQIERRGTTNDKHQAS